MSKRVICVCDRCGKDAPNGFWGHLSETIFIFNRKKWGLCARCTQELGQWLNNLGRYRVGAE